MAVSPLPCLSGSKGAAQNALAPAGDDTRVRPCNDAAEAAGTAAAADEAAHLLVEACKRGDVAALALRLQAADVNRFVRGGSAARPFAASPLWWCVAFLSQRLQSRLSHPLTRRLRPPGLAARRLRSASTRCSMRALI